MADRPLVDKTAERLMAFILDNGYEVGQKLPNEYDLSEALGAGRSTVREAVRSLVARNILEVRQGSGTYISSKRGVVEDPFGFAFVKDRIKLTTDLADDPKHLELDVQFHSLLAEMSGNVAVKSLIPVINESIQIINEDYTNRRMKQSSIEAHRNILKAIQSRHPIAAYDSMLSHILTVRQTVLNDWYEKDIDIQGLPKSK